MDSPLFPRLHLLSSGHNREPARSGLERATALLAMRRRSYQRRQSSFHQITFHCPNSHQRIRHSRSPCIQPVWRIRRRTGLARWILVKTAPERAGMIRGRTHTRPLLLAPQSTVARFVHHLATTRCWNRSARGAGPVHREPDRWRRGARRAGEINSRWRGRSLEKARRPRRKSRRRRRSKRGHGARGVESPWRRLRTKDWSTVSSRRRRHFRLICKKRI